MPKLHYRMTATKDYRNGSIAWPAGMSAYWPVGETRDIPPTVFDQLQRDAGPFNYEMVLLPEAGEAPAPVTIDRSDGVQAEEASESGKALAQYSAEQAAAPVDKRAAALEKDRAAKAAKKAAKE